MAVENLKDFGNLYRAAFAERDPKQKAALLHEVQKRIDQWRLHSEAETDHRQFPAAGYSEPKYRTAP